MLDQHADAGSFEMKLLFQEKNTVKFGKNCSITKIYLSKTIT